MDTGFCRDGWHAWYKNNKNRGAEACATKRGRWIYIYSVDRANKRYEFVNLNHACFNLTRVLETGTILTH